MRGRLLRESMLQSNSSNWIFWERFDLLSKSSSTLMQIQVKIKINFPKIFFSATSRTLVELKLEQH